MNNRARLPALLATFLFPLIGMAQTQTGQPQDELPLLNSVTTTISGTMVPATTVQTDATTQTVVPASCRFSLALPPGQKSIEARRVSDIAMDSANNTCNAQFEVGQPQTVAALSDAERANLANTTVNSSSGVPAQTGSALNAQPDAALATIQSAGFLNLVDRSH